MAQGVEIAAAYVSIVPSAKGIAQGIQRELGDPVDRAAKDAGRTIEDNIGGGANRGAQAAKVALSAIGSAAVLSAINRAKDAASGLQQAVGGTEAVFGEASAAVDEFALSAAEAVGLSERSTRELTSQLGASLKGYGFAVDEAAAKSIELTTIGADLAATFGGTTADAVAALSSALRGEFDPLERYGVALRQSAIDAQAVELGLVAAGTEVDAMSRAQAALSLITEQSADAQGQFARESDSAAGQAQIAGAKMEDSAANLGEALLPIYARVSETIGTVADVFASLPSSVQTGVVALAGVVAVAGPLTNLVGLYRSFRPAAAAAATAVASTATAAQNSADSFQDLYSNSSRSSTALRGMAVAGGALAAVGLAVELYKIAEAAGEVSVNLEEAAGLTSEELVNAFGAIEAFFGHSEAMDAFQQLAEGGEAGAAAAVDLRDAYLAAGNDVSEFDAILAETADAHAISADRTADGAEALGEFTSASGPAADAQEELGEETRTTARELFDWAGALDDGISSLRDFYDLQTAASDVQANFRDTLRDLEDFGADQVQSRADALEAVADAQERVNAATDETERQAALEDLAEAQARVNDATLEGQERIDEFRGFLQAGRDDILDAADALFHQGQTTEEVIPQLQAMADELFGVAEQAGLTTDESFLLRTELGLLPDQIPVNVRTNVPTVLADFQRLRDLALAFGFQDLQFLGPRSLGPGSNFQARASGGDFDPGWLLTGEEGPELTWVNAPGTVVSAPDTKALLAQSAASTSVTQQFYGKVDAADVGDATFREMRRLQLTGRT